MPTFLQLCQTYRSELGIPGTGPGSVLNQVGELARVVQDIQDADMDVRRRWRNWDFNWAVFSTFVVMGQNVLQTTKPADVAAYDLRTAWLNYGQTDAAYLTNWRYETLRDALATQSSELRKPVLFAIRPDKTILLDALSDEEYPFRIEYWKRATPMTADATVSPIPEDFHRIIIARAKIHYAEREDAPELMAGATAEFEDVLEQLEASYLPGQRSAHESSAVTPLQVFPE